MRLSRSIKLLVPFVALTVVGCGTAPSRDVLRVIPPTTTRAAPRSSVVQPLVAADRAILLQRYIAAARYADMVRFVVVAARLRALTERQVDRPPSSRPDVRAATTTPSGYDWDAIARCETGQNWHMTGSRYSSGLGVMNQAVRENAPPDVAARILDGTASREEQIVMAETLEAKHGIHSWACGQKLYP